MIDENGLLSLDEGENGVQKSLRKEWTERGGREQHDSNRPMFKAVIPDMGETRNTNARVPCFTFKNTTRD